MPVSVIERRAFDKALVEYDPASVVLDMVAVPASCASAPAWVRRGGFVGDLGADVGILAPWCAPLRDRLEAGAYSYAFVGVTRDQYGSPLGSVNLRLFRASDSLLVTTGTSDPAGNFSLVTPYYPNAHFIVYQKTGAPDVQGVSVWTLIGT